MAQASLDFLSLNHLYIENLNMKKTLIASIVFCSLLTVSSVFAAGATTTKTPTSSPQLPTVNTHKNVIKGLVILNDYFARDEKKVYGINDE